MTEGMLPPRFFPAITKTAKHQPKRNDQTLRSITAHTGGIVATLLRIENLKTQFFTSAGIVKAVDGITFNVEEGETVAIVGESGCGKSVSALSILRLIPWPPGKIVEGSINFDGKDLLSLDEEAMRNLRGKDISMVFQEPMTSLNPVLSIGEQLTETLITHFPISDQEASEKAL